VDDGYFATMRVPLGVVLGLVMMVATAACLAPGWKAAREDPAGALRGD
jgi:ABC-type lipoprotein release transport system permease subunit